MQIMVRYMESRGVLCVKQACVWHAVAHTPDGLQLIIKSIHLRMQCVYPLPYIRERESACKE